ncbi:MAG: DUF1735 domain-containing protein [Muribaculaceae bacterium]|nr:DUF1735 domain-containing protein [Muribaculaceae bacterium]
MKKSIFSIFALGALLCSCHNGDVDYPDFDYQTLSFSYPNPVRTITLGYEADVDNSGDNEHRFKLQAVLGGVNENRNEHSVTFRIADELCDNLFLDNGEPLLPMPKEYYSIATDRMVIPKGSVIGGVDVQLTDAFFADPKSVEVNYVIPVLLVNSEDSILSGKAKDGVVNPNRLVKDDWSIAPKDFTLYAVKYKNRYDGCWLSKGTDRLLNATNKEIEAGTATDTIIDRQYKYWEKADLRYFKTVSLNRFTYTQEFDVPIIQKNGKKGSQHIVCKMILDVDDNGNVTITSDSEDCVVSGSGTWKENGAEKAFGDRDRDYMHLQYEFTTQYMSHVPKKTMSTYKMVCDEELVLRDRQNSQEWFNYTFK